MFTRNRWIVFGGLLALSLIALSCAPAPVPVVQTVVVPGAPQVVTATPPPAKPRALNIIANWGGGEKEAFQKVLDAFTAKTKIPVNYETSRNLEALTRTRVAGGNPPDITMEPRPGAIAEFVKSNWLVPLDEPIGNEVLNPDSLSKAFGKSYLDLGKVDGTQYGLIFKADSKSTFWYKPSSFKDLGVQPPKTLDDLFKIADQYKAKGKIPFAAGGKDGWTLTDYFENIYARVASPQMYQDLHASHKIAWTDPSVKRALTLLAKFFQTSYEPGGVQGVVGTGFTDSIAQVFGTSAQAEMYYEGGFVGTIVLSDVNKNLKPGQDIDFFLFPQIDSMYGDPIIGGGDFAIMFKDSPEGRAFMQYLASKEAGEVFAGTNSISPNKLVDPSKFSSDLRKKEFGQIANASVFLFDGSDQAPSAFGGGCEFTHLQDLVLHPNDVDRIAQALEDCAKSAYGP